MHYSCKVCGGEVGQMRPRSVCFDPLCPPARHKSTAPDSIIRSSSAQKRKVDEIYDICASEGSHIDSIDTSVYVDVKLLRHRIHILHCPLPLPTTSDADTSTINLHASDVLLPDNIVYDDSNNVYGEYDTAHDYPSENMCDVYTARATERSVAALLTRFVRSYEISKFLVICTSYTNNSTINNNGMNGNRNRSSKSESPLQGIFIRVLNSNYTASLSATEAAPHNSDQGPKPDNYSVSAPCLRAGVKLSYRVYTDTAYDSNIHTSYSSTQWPHLAKVPLSYGDYAILLSLLQYRSTHTGMGNNNVFTHEEITCLFT